MDVWNNKNFQLKLENTRKTKREKNWINWLLSVSVVLEFVEIDCLCVVESRVCRERPSFPENLFYLFLFSDNCSFPRLPLPDDFYFLITTHLIN